MLDFLYVASRLPLDEQEQITAFTGHHFTIDGAAVGCFIAQGPKWVIKKDGMAISIFGAIPERPGVWRDFMLNTPDSFAPENYFAVTRACRRVMNQSFDSGIAHRIECIVPLSRSHVFRWYRALGYRAEAVLPGYLANAQPAVLFARLKKGIEHGNGLEQLGDQRSDSSR